MKKTIDVCDKCKKEKSLATFEFPHSMFYRSTNPDRDPLEAEHSVMEIDTRQKEYCLDCASVVVNEFMTTFAFSIFAGGNWPKEITGRDEHQSPPFGKYGGRHHFPHFKWQSIFDIIGRF